MLNTFTTNLLRLTDSHGSDWKAGCFANTWMSEARERETLVLWLMRGLSLNIFRKNGKLTTRVNHMSKLTTRVNKLKPPLRTDLLDQFVCSKKKIARVTIGVARGGQRGHNPKKFLENMVILCFERRFSNLKSYILAPQNFWAGYATACNAFTQIFWP